MNITTVTVGPVATRCYILSREDASECVVIDPGDEPERILRAAAGKRVAAILLTHGHFDHIGAVSALAKDGAPVLIHALDADMLTDPKRNASLALMRVPVSACPATDLLRDGDRRTLAGLEIEVIHTPGHTPGSVCYRIGDHLFTGDTLFADGWGRTDLPGGDEHAIMASLRQVIPLARTMPFHPGHGDDQVCEL